MTVTTFWMAFEFLSNVMDQILFLFLINHQLPDEHPHYFRDVISLIFFSIALTGMQQLDIPFIASFSTMFAIHLAYCLLFRHGSLLQRAIWPVIARIAFFSMNQTITMFLSSIPGFDYQAMMEQTPQRFLAMCFYMFTSIIVFYLLSRTSPRNRNLPKRTQFASIGMAITCIIFAGVIFDLSPAAMEHTESAWLLNITTAGFMISSIAWLLILDALSARNAEHLTLQAAHQRMEDEKRYTDALQNLDEQLRSARHDYMHHLLALSGLAEKKDISGIKTYLSRLCANIPHSSITITPYPQLDAIINAKLQTANALLIQSEVLFIVPAKLSIDIVDLCSILGNILDNAIEAAQQVPEDQRYLRFFSGPASNMWLIKVENSCTGKYKRDEDTFLSTKPDAWHGLGLKHVQRLVENVGGFVQLTAEATRFRTEIFLPWPKYNQVMETTSGDGHF